MLLSQALDDYIKRYPIYKGINFSTNSSEVRESLHPLYILTQAIIDSFISSGNNRIAIVLPDDECSILPLIIAKYFANVQYELDYAGNVLDEIKPGQCLRLGKAVVEFCELSEDKTTIKFRVGKTHPMWITCPINGIHYLFEKCNGAISSYNVWRKEEEKASAGFKHADGLINSLKTKRTVLRKTIIILSAKNEFKEFSEDVKINGNNFEDVLSFGEIDLDSVNGFALYNKGKLDCVPSVSVTAKLEELYYLFRNAASKNIVSAVYCTADKFDELISNTDTLRKILRNNVPFISFVPESKFDDFPALSSLGFDLWHWKPSTMHSEAFLAKHSMAEGALFGKISQKIGSASLADFKSVVIKTKILREIIYYFRRLLQSTFNVENSVRQVVRRIWLYQKEISGLMCDVGGNVFERLCEKLKLIKDDWSKYEKYYAGQALHNEINRIIACFEDCIGDGKLIKYKHLDSEVASAIHSNQTVTVLVSDKYEYFQETYKFFESRYGDNLFKLQRLSDFYEEQCNQYKKVNNLIVTWFDKDEYIAIKQTYCYDKLIFVLYDYENKWREKYVQNFDKCMPHASIKKSAEIVHISANDVWDRPFDDTITDEIDYELDEISDYDISRNIVKVTIKDITSDKESAEAFECLPVVLSKDKIAYFYPTHDIIEITALVKGNHERPVKKEASKLKKGDKILIRLSDKDIIKEKADELMSVAGESGIRKTTEIWFDILDLYSKDKSIGYIQKELNDAGGDCTFQQVRYWLSGETILPLDKKILIAIGKVASQEPKLKLLCEEYSNCIDKIYECGKRVRGYHRQAGYWLTSALKNKASEIKNIANSSSLSGHIEGIGDVQVYTVEEILDKETVGRAHLNRIEDV